MTVSFTDLTGIQRDVLRTISFLAKESDEPVRGIDVHADVCDIGGEGSIRKSRVYDNLDGLTDKGLLEKHLGYPDGRSNSFRLTVRGERVLAEYLEHMRADLARQQPDDHAESTETPEVGA